MNPYLLMMSLVALLFGSVLPASAAPRLLATLPIESGNTVSGLAVSWCYTNLHHDCNYKKLESKISVWKANSRIAPKSKALVYPGNQLQIWSEPPVFEGQNNLPAGKHNDPPQRNAEGTDRSAGVKTGSLLIKGGESFHRVDSTPPKPPLLYSLLLTIQPALQYVLATASLLPLPIHYINLFFAVAVLILFLGFDPRTLRRRTHKLRSIRFHWPHFLRRRNQNTVPSQSSNRHPVPPIGSTVPPSLDNRGPIPDPRITDERLRMIPPRNRKIVERMLERERQAS